MLHRLLAMQKLLSLPLFIGFSLISRYYEPAPQFTFDSQATPELRRRAQLMIRSARIATEFVCHIETSCAAVGVVELCAGASLISSEASRLMSTRNPPSSPR